MMPKGLLSAFMVVLVGLLAIGCFAEETYGKWHDKVPPSVRMYRDDLDGERDDTLVDDVDKDVFEPYQVLHLEVGDPYMNQVERIDPDDMGTFIIKEISKYPMAKRFLEVYTEKDLSGFAYFINDEIDMEGRNDLVQTLLQHRPAAKYGDDLVEVFLYIPSYASTEYRDLRLREMTEWVDRHVESHEANALLKMSVLLLQDAAKVVKEIRR